MDVLLSKVIAEYQYPEHDTYSGPSQRGEIKFRSVKGLSLVPDWLLENVIVAKAKLADVTPLRATLKESQIKEGFLDYITSEYTLILYFHDSPAVASIILSIAAVLTAAGFLVLSWNATPDTWRAIAEVPKGVAEIPKYTSNIILYSGLALLGYMGYKAYSAKSINQ